MWAEMKAVLKAGQMVHSRVEMWAVAKVALKALTMVASKAGLTADCWVVC